MAYNTDIAYLYDGSFEGLMCCVFESYDKKEKPSAVLSPEEEQLVLYEVREVYTDPIKANRVMDSIPKKLGSEAMHLVKMTFLSIYAEKELKILEFLHYAYSAGPRAVSQLAHPAVASIHDATRSVLNEAHYFNEFIRFSEYNGLLISTIEPKAFVLPLLIDHFKDRLPSEKFLIYDKSHKYALLYSDGRYEITPMEELIVPQECHDELKYRALWQMFYDTIAVEGRINHKLRMNNMPKRYWSNMTEFQRERDKLPPGALRFLTDK